MKKYIIQFEPVDRIITSVNLHDPENVFAIGELVLWDDETEGIRLTDLNAQRELVYGTDLEIYVHEKRDGTLLYNKLMEKKAQIAGIRKALREESLLNWALSDYGSFDSVKDEKDRLLTQLEAVSAELQELGQEYNAAKEIAESAEQERRDIAFEKMHEYDFSICMITKDEHEYLEEFLQHHLALGFDHIYIYDNMSSPSVEEALTKMVGVDLSKITVKRVKSRPMLQDWVYNLWLREDGIFSRYVAFIDTDELLDFGGKTIREFMANPKFRRKDVGGVYLNWETYNADGETHKRYGKLRERFNKISEANKVECNVGKSIVRTSKVKKMHIHYADYRSGIYDIDTLGEIPQSYELKRLGGRAVEADEAIISAAKAHAKTANSIGKVRHYFTRSLEEWVYKILRGDCAQFYRRSLVEFVKHNPDLEKIANNVFHELFGDAQSEIKCEYQKSRKIGKEKLRKIIEDAQKKALQW
ncbi:MAG: glycosyltransferase family 2 protein [Firmicutes bacterium]|nr:glycosyltransferase family 2 protein [Bacillota bacterium]